MNSQLSVRLPTRLKDYITQCAETHNLTRTQYLQLLIEKEMLGDSDAALPQPHISDNSEIAAIYSYINQLQARLDQRIDALMSTDTQPTPQVHTIDWDDCEYVWGDGYHEIDWTTRQCYANPNIPTGPTPDALVTDKMVSYIHHKPTGCCIAIEHSCAIEEGKMTLSELRDLSLLYIDAIPVR